jgi:hypothetical protein
MCKACFFDTCEQSKGKKLLFRAREKRLESVEKKMTYFEKNDQSRID